MITVDIVMPVHNRTKHTVQSISSLYANTDWDKFILHVIDDGSDDETRDVLCELANRYDFSLYRNFHAQSPGVSRNQVCNIITESNLRGTYLYHSDNDVYFMPGWLEKTIEAYEATHDLGIRLVGAGCHPYLQNNDVLTYANGQVGVKDAVSGYSQLMSWETWDTFGPFDETMKDAERKIMGSEDWAFCQKIVKAGYKVGAIQPEFVIHCGKSNTYGELATGHETFIQKEGIYIG